MPEALIIDAVRTPMGRYRGALAGVRPDDLGAHVIAAAVERTGLDPAGVADVYWGAANQAGEDNRDAARMCSLLAGLPVEVPGVTVNRLCASGLEAVNQAARALRLGEGDLYLAGGARVDEPRPVGRAEARDGARPRAADDARHRARLAARQPQDGRDVLDRVDGRDGRERRRALRRLARRSGRVRAAQPPARGRGRRRRAASTTRSSRSRRRPPGGRGEPVTVAVDEGPRPDTTLERLAALAPVFREGGSVTAGNASTLNDGAACLVLADEDRARELGRRAAGPDRGIRSRGRRPGGDGDRAGAGDPQGARRRRA